MPGEAGLRRLAHAIEDLVDIYLAAADRGATGKRLDTVHQRDDAIGLLADQLGQLARRRIGVLFEQLRGAANAGERVLDLVRQHRRHCGHRPGGVQMRQLAVHLVGHRPLVQHQHQQVAPLPRQRALNRRRTRRNARPFDRHVVFDDRSAGAPYRVGERENRAVRQQQPGQLAADQRGGARAEKLLGRRIDKAHGPLRSSARTGLGKAASSSAVSGGAGERVRPAGSGCASAA